MKRPEAKIYFFARKEGQMQRLFAVVSGNKASSESSESIDENATTSRLNATFFESVLGEDLKELATEAYQRLLRRGLDEQFQVRTLLSKLPELRELQFTGLNVLVVPEDVGLREEAETKKIAETFYALSNTDALRYQYPEWPAVTAPLEEHKNFITKVGDLGLYDNSLPWVQDALKEHSRKNKMLLHICCGPDAAGVINQLKDKYELVCFWYDPNIQPKEEYDKRLEAFMKVAEYEKVPYIIGEYDVDRFFDEIRGLETSPEQGAKCSVCYDMRLERSAVEAKKHNCDLYSTTLAISPHKVQAKLKNFGELSARRHGVRYIAENFMKNEGFKQSVVLSHELNLFRQDYCGCLYSLHEGGPEARKTALALGLDSPEKISAASK